MWSIAGDRLWICTASFPRLQEVWHNLQATFDYVCIIVPFPLVLDHVLWCNLIYEERPASYAIMRVYTTSMGLMPRHLSWVYSIPWVYSIYIGLFHLHRSTLLARVYSISRVCILLAWVYSILRACILLPWVYSILRVCILLSWVCSICVRIFYLHASVHILRAYILPPCVYSIFLASHLPLAYTSLSANCVHASSTSMGLFHLACVYSTSMRLFHLSCVTLAAGIYTAVCKLCACIFYWIVSHLPLPYTPLSVKCVVCLHIRLHSSTLAAGIYTAVSKVCTCIFNCIDPHLPLPYTPLSAKYTL